MDDLIPLVLTVAPELARWLSGDGAGETRTAVVNAVQVAVGTIDPAMATVTLEKAPATRAQLRVRLAQIAADREAAAHAAALRAFAGVAQRRTAYTAAAWSAPIISAAVLVTFGCVMILVLTLGVPVGTETVVNMLLGTLAAMATSVVSYWVGSSAGSARKEERLAQSGK